MPERPAGVTCILDTGVVIDFLRGRSYTVELFRQIAREGELAMSAVTQVEIFAALQPSAEEVTADVLDAFISFDVTPEIARRAGVLLNQLRSRGEQADIADAMVAATAQLLDVPLVTNDTTRYRFLGVQVIRGQTARRV